MKKVFTEKLRGQHKIFCAFVLLGVLVAVIYVYTARVHPKIEFELTSTNIGEPVCIFYMDENMENFDDEHMMQDEIVSGTHMYSFDVPDIERLRIDLGTNAGTSLISNVSVKSFFITRKASASYMATCSVSPDVGTVTVSEGGSALSIESIGADPYIIVGDVEEFDRTVNILEIGILLLVILAIIMISGVLAVYYKELGIFLRKIFQDIAEKISSCIKKTWSMPFCRCMLFFMLFGIVYLYQAVNSYPRVEFELLSTNIREGICVFYADKKVESFDSEHMTAEAIEFGWQKYSFDVPDIDRLRIDFGENVGSTQISNIMVKTFFTTKEVSVQYISECAFSADVGEVVLDGNILQMESIGTDPYVILGTLEDVESIFDWQKAVLLAAAFVLMLAISGVIARYEDVIEKLLNIKKKHAVIISCIIFFAYRIAFMVMHKGFFAIDEFYHISTLNQDYITDYNRAPYVNFMEEIICKIFGQTDLTVKFVPFIMGTISFLCCLYLLYNIYENPYWIIAVSSTLTFIPYILYNHFFIRMYVFLEALVMLDCVLFYNVGKKAGTKWEKLNLFFALVLTIFYYFNTQDSSAKAVFLLVIIVCLYYFGKKHIKSITDYIKKNHVLAIWAAVLIVLCGSFVMLLNLQWIERFITGIVKMSTEGYRLHADSPVFLKTVFGKMFYVSVPFFLSLIYVWKKKIDDKKILFVMAGVPLLGYIVFFHSTYLLRTYVAFLPIMCVVSFLLWDRIKLLRLQCIAISLLIVGLSLNVEGNFWKRPGVPNEIICSNLGEAVETAKELEKQGYEIVPMMTQRPQLAYFDLLDTDIQLNMEDLKKEIWEADTGTAYRYGALTLDGDLVNKAIGVISNELEAICESNNKRVLVADESGTAVFRIAYKKEWANRCEVEKIDEFVSLIIVN